MTHRTATECSVEGCGRPYRCTGFCAIHYDRWRAHGDPLANVPVRERTKGALCCIDGCDTAIRAKGLCALHYERMRRTGRPDIPTPPPTPPCAVETCDRNALALGYCSAHHQRLHTHGNVRADIPLRQLPKQDERNDIGARIASKVLESESGCLEWTGSLDRGGYGSISWNGRGWRVHRAAWVLEHGEFPEGDWTLDHLCYNRRCVNVDHMEMVSRGENTMRAMLRKYAGTDRLPEPVLEFLRAASEGLREGREFFEPWMRAS